MVQGHLGWWVLALVALGVLVMLAQGWWLQRRISRLGQALKVPGVDGAAGTGVGDLVGGLLLAGAQLDATLRELRRAHLQAAAPVADDGRARLGRELAAAGASVAKIAAACGMSECEAELLRVVYARQAAPALDAVSDPAPAAKVARDPAPATDAAAVSAPPVASTPAAPSGAAVVRRKASRRRAAAKPKAKAGTGAPARA